MKWQLATLANKTVDRASASLSTYRELYCMLEGLQGKFNDLNLIENQITPTNTPDEIGVTPLSRDISGIFIQDSQTVRTKGCPKMASRIPAGIEVSQATKKRKCGTVVKRDIMQQHAQTKPRYGFL
ncbi:hypothetical protein CFOL_v3_11751 [Cephalotus follicularis]|uniref:Uncharacterized protein n=1 Tax=Cephalotus follicularis TaxID=3775 RepID=A0A1Q3BJZ8_CEPFO|nr:hypothetical protein CFOL_v3_11751 [Cephalotus follicularis]